MKISIIDQAFDKNLFNSTATHPLQSWEWGEARKKMGIEILRIAQYSNKQITNVYQVTFHKVPHTPYKVGYLPRSEFPSDKVLEFIFDYGKKNNVIFIKIEPCSPAVIPSEARDLKKKDSSVASLLRNDGRVVKSPHPLFPPWTQILDLTEPENELLKNMNPKTRYNIRLAQKKGVTVKEESNEKGFAIFSKLYFATCRRQKYHGHNPNYHKTIWESLKNKIAHILIATYNNIPLAAYELFYFNQVFYYPYGGTSLEYRNFMASNLLMWEAVKLGKKLGAEKFDMWGSLAPDYDPNHSWSGFTRFKEGYGSQFIELVGSYDLIVNPNLYKIFSFIQKIREIYLNLRKS